MEAQFVHIGPWNFCVVIATFPFHGPMWTEAQVIRGSQVV